MLEAFIDWRPIGRSEFLLNVITRLTNDYVASGLALSGPQVFGLLVAEDKVEDTAHSYERVSLLLKNAHLSGRIDWQVGRDMSMSFFGDKGGVEVWTRRDDLVVPLLAALDPFRAGVMVVRESPSVSSLYEATKRTPRAVLTLFDPTDLEPRLAALGSDVDVFEIPFASPERIAPDVFIAMIRDEVEPYAKPARPDLSLDQAYDKMAFSRIEAAMAEVGDTTRAVALKKRITAILEEA